MAAASAAATKTEETKSSGPSFKGKRLDLPDIEGYWDVQPGSEVEGKALGRFQIENDDGKIRDIVVVKLSKPCMIKKKGNDKAIQADVGQFIGVGITHKNQDLLNFVAKHGMIWCKAVKKMDIGGGRKMWSYEYVGEEGKEAPPPPIATKAASKGDNDEVPF
jgi:hypothetical protein